MSDTAPAQHERLLAPAEPDELDRFASSELHRRETEAAENAPAPAETEAAENAPAVDLMRPEDAIEDVTAIAAALKTTLVVMFAARFTPNDIEQALKDAEDGAKRTGRRLGVRAARMMGPGWLGVLAEVADSFQPMLRRFAVRRATATTAATP
jgi:hypothetical protein